MASKWLSPDQVRILMNEGTFRGLHMLLRSKQITEEQARGVLARSYETLLGEVKEARRELQRVQNALVRLGRIFSRSENDRRNPLRPTRRTYKPVWH